MISKRVIFSIVTTGLISVSQSADEIAPETRIAAVEKEVATMNGTLNRLLKEVGHARDEGNLPRVNCLTVKLNLVKGLVKASEQAKIVLAETAYKHDSKTADAYGAKIKAYGESVAEVEQSIDECTGKENNKGEEGITLVYVRPEGEGNPLERESTNSLQSTPGISNDGYPVAPPASPFR